MKRAYKPSPVDLTLAAIVGDPSIKQSARVSAENILRERANLRKLSFGEHREALLRSCRP